MMGLDLDQVNVQSWNSRLMRNYSATHRWESAEQTFPKTTSSGCSLSAAAWEAGQESIEGTWRALTVGASPT